MIEVAVDRETSGAYVVRYGREALLELPGTAICRHRERAGNGDTVFGRASIRPEAHDPALHRAPRGCHRVRAVRGAQHDEPCDALRPGCRERERDHAAVRGADRGVQHVDAEIIEHQCEGAGLVGGRESRPVAVLRGP